MRAWRTAAWLTAARLTVLMVMAGVTGCQRGNGATTSVTPDPNTPVLVEAENHFQGDLVIYLLRGAHKERLGMVTALSSGTFTLRWRNLGTSGSARLMAYPLAGRSFESEPLHLQPGQSIKWTLEADLDRSTLVVH
jgi:hypothetical protein